MHWPSGEKYKSQRQPWRSISTRKSRAIGDPFNLDPLPQMKQPVRAGESPSRQLHFEIHVHSVPQPFHNFLQSAAL